MQDWWVAGELGLTALGLMGLAAPFFGMGLAAWKARRLDSSVGATIGAAVGGFLGGCVVLLVMFTMTCNFPPPGHGSAAQRGYRRAEPVIAAIDRFHVDHASYPDSLARLVPAYLATEALATPDKTGERHPLGYNRMDAGYELLFRYDGPGANRCRYRPGGVWECSRYW